MQDHVPENRTSLVRKLMIFFMVTVLGFVLLFAGRFIYNLGQTTALKASGVNLTPLGTTTSVLQSTSTITPTLQTPTYTPSPTSTSFFPATPTQTKIPWTSCPGIVITVEDTAEGNFLHVLRCEDGLEYEIGPLTRGVYAVSPNDQYLVYCDLNGILYAARIGAPALTVIRKTQREFFVFGKNVDPIFVLTFTGEAPYVLRVHEKRYEQNMPIKMPGWLSE